MKSQQPLYKLENDLAYNKRFLKEVQPQIFTIAILLRDVYTGCKSSNFGMWFNSLIKVDL
jgi:hypothetical protein